jgi:hypothetical protein
VNRLLEDYPNMSELVCVPCGDLVVGDIIKFNSEPIGIDDVTRCTCGEHVFLWFNTDNELGFLLKELNDSAVMYRLRSDDRRRISESMQQFNDIVERKERLE